MRCACATIDLEVTEASCHHCGSLTENINNDHFICDDCASEYCEDCGIGDCEIELGNRYVCSDCYSGACADAYDRCKDYD